MATPHIAAPDGAFAPAVLMPGDPYRADRMAQSVLTDPKVISDVRGIRAYTGTVDGRRLSIMASGMGMASIALYATELYRFYGVKRIIRVGTAGGIATRVARGDTIVAIGAHSTSDMNQLRIPSVNFSAVADFTMASAAVAAALGDPSVKVGTIVSEDHFYFKAPGAIEALQAHGVLGVEMEAAGLYGVAAAEGQAALAILTVSDHLTVTGQDMTSEERETLFARSLALALAAAFAA
ncbi:MAG: DeoD-type purine-nucleoside phosphorylase [Bifidobacteriaceae bacterium]|jgi:purine-nucleoside phosphorylase|nr:DeoD-type purine-nucleoside phosphorylase [Bifidobacteriaceae bacterium]